MSTLSTRAGSFFIEFDLVALGTRGGGTQYDQRGRDLGPAGIGFLLTPAPNDPPVAPAFIFEYGWR